MINVLLIEDDIVDARSVQRRLAAHMHESYKLLNATSLKEGLGILNTEIVDLVLLDLSLPDSQQLNTLDQVHDSHPEVPIVVLSGLADQDLSIEALRRGAQDYLVKGREHEDGLVRITRHALERHAIMRELEDAKQAAASASIAKSNFLANMSHEIRTPLTAILGFTEILMNPNLSQEQKAALDAIHRNGQHLLGVIDDILDLSKIEAGHLSVENVKFSIFELIDQIEASFKLKAIEKGINFKVEHNFPLPQYIHSDPTRLKQILFNLIGNALKFTQRGEVRLVNTLNAENLIEFRVVDTGIGLTKAEQTKLFKAFSQADTSITRKFGGTGLGLVISKQIAMKLGGSIGLFSEKGKGSTFVVTINPGPINQNELVSQPPGKQKQSLSCDTAVQSRSKLKGKVLVVDDMPDNRELLAHLLGKIGIKPELVNNGVKALSHICTQDFDLVLLDMQMPVMDGYKTVKAMREKGFDKPVIAITASVMASANNRCIEAGCDEYLRKPFKQEHLFSLLGRYLEKDLSAQAPQEESSACEASKLLAEDPGMRDVVIGFIDRLPNRLTTISQAFDDNDWKELARLVHQLAGSAAFGFPALGDLAFQLECASKAEQIDEIRPKMVAIKAIINEILAFKRELVSGERHNHSSAAAI